LSPTEFTLLHYFMRNPGRVLSKTQILEYVWNYDFSADTGVIESHVLSAAQARHYRAGAAVHRARCRLRAAPAPDTTTVGPITSRMRAAGWVVRRVSAATPLRLQLVPRC
jgi:hypothetical protein